MDIYVTGIGMVGPLGQNREEFWKNLIAGKSGIRQIESFDTEGFETTIAGEIQNWDPIPFVGKKEAPRMDRSAQIVAAAALEAHEQSGFQITNENSSRVISFIAGGIGMGALTEGIDTLKSRGPSRVSPFLISKVLTDTAAGRISILLKGKGLSLSVSTACASGADAIGLASDYIREGKADMAFAGGTEAAICPIVVAGFNACKALSTRNAEPSKASRPFDLKRDGFVIGEGAAVLVLENAESVINRGIVPIAKITGWGATSDAFHLTHPAPEGEGGARAMKLALEQAKLKPEEIDYINAHGTSTPLNDAIETMAMKSVFGEHASNIPISSTKSMTGHLLTGSGALEAAISVLTIPMQIIPPTINLESPDPDCDLDYTPNTARETNVRKAMSNSFGFTGHNTSLIFEETD